MPTEAPLGIAPTPPARPVRAGLKSIMIQGKPYVQVHTRIQAFREVHPDWAILCDILTNDAGVIVMQCTIKNELGNIVCTAHASERQDSSVVNRSSYVENCETSAVGRALGLLGIGCDTSLASADEVDRAIQRQQAAPRTPYPRPDAAPTTPAPAASASTPPRDAQQEGRQLADQARRLAVTKQISAAFKGLDNHAQQAIRDRAGKSMTLMSLDELLAVQGLIQDALADASSDAIF